MVNWYQHIKEFENESSYLIYIDNFLSKEDLYICQMWLEKRYYSGDFIGETNKSESRMNTRNRKQMWFQKDGHYFCPKWRERHPRWQSKDYDPLLIYIQNCVKNQLMNNDTFAKLGLNFNNVKCENIDTGFHFNSCLVNVYEDGNEGISPHRDNMESFGMYPTIVGLSIGATRKMKIQKIIFDEHNSLSLKVDPDPDNKGLSMEFPLENNSLFIMMGASQKYYTHEIVKEPDILDRRFSFTFRHWKHT